MSGTDPTTSSQKILESTTISKSDGWWTRVVRDRRPGSGEMRLRLERKTRDETGTWKNVHTWRVRPDFWQAEHTAVTRFQQGAGTTSPPATPVHPRYKVTRYLKVRKDRTRWVAVVRLERPTKPPCTRLYHWELPDETTRQKWTIGVDWSLVREVATRKLSKIT